jgi:putative transposase
VLQVAPSTIYAARARPPSARAVRDAQLVPQICKVWGDNLQVYGADKVWDQLNKNGTTVARCTVERLMRQIGIQGCRRGRQWVVTTESDDSQHRPADLVDRDFHAAAPNRLWVADLTYVKTHTGWVYAAFIIDVFSRMIVGWQASRSLRTDLAIDALEMAVHNRGRTDDLSGLIHHSDRGVQYLAVRYSERLADNDIVASVGSKGESYDDALVESFNGLYKWELIYPADPGGDCPTSSSPPSSTSTGSTTAGSTAKSPTAPATPPQPPSKPTTTVPSRSQPTRSRPKPPSVYRTRGGSPAVHSGPT